MRGGVPGCIPNDHVPPPRNLPSCLAMAPGSGFGSDQPLAEGRQRARDHSLLFGPRRKHGGSGQNTKEVEQARADVCQAITDLLGHDGLKAAQHQLVWLKCETRSKKLMIFCPREGGICSGCTTILVGSRLVNERTSKKWLLVKDSFLTTFWSIPLGPS